MVKYHTLISVIYCIKSLFAILYQFLFLYAVTISLCGDTISTQKVHFLSIYVSVLYVCVSASSFSLQG